MMRSKLRHVARLITVSVAATILITCGDDGSSTHDDRGIFGEWADLLGQSAESFIGPSDNIFASFGALWPDMAVVLGESRDVDGSPLEPLSCLREGIGGKVYDFDGQHYSGTLSAAIPAYTARFKLYEVSMGQPITESEIGFIDFSCVDVGIHLTEVQIFADSGLVASATYSNSSGNLSVTFRSEDGRSLQVLVQPDPELLGYYALTYMPSDTLEVHHLGSTNAGDEQITLIGIYNPGNKPFGSCWYYVEVDSMRQISTGYVEQNRNSVPGYAACILSGTITNPVFTRSSQLCAIQNYELWNVNNAQLEAMSETYRALYSVWARVTDLLRLCRLLVPPS